MPPAGASTGRPGPQRPRERGRQFRLDADDLDVSRIPSRDTADQPPATDGHQHRVEPRRLTRELHSECSLAEQRFRLIVGVHRERPCLLAPGLAGRERVGVPVAHDGERRAVCADALDLRGRRHRRDEDLRAHAESHRGVGHRGAVVTSRGGGDAGLRDASQEQVGERPSSLERPGVLQELELQREGKGRKPEVDPAHLEDRRHSDIRPDDRLNLFDASPINHAHDDRILTWS